MPTKTQQGTISAVLITKHHERARALAQDEEGDYILGP